MRSSLIQRVALPLFVLGVAALAIVPLAADERTLVNVGVVYDGPPPDGGSLAPERLRGLLEMIRQETTALTAQDFDVRFPADKQLSGEWTEEGIRFAIDRQLEDPEVHLVLTLGIFSTNDACRRRELSKPVIAPFAIDIKAQSLPVTHDDEGRMISGIRNLSYLSTPGTILRDLRRFREIVSFSRVHVLTDALVPETMQQRIFGYEGFHPRQVVSELFVLKQYYQRLVHAVAEIVIELDNCAKVISANLEALRLLGQSEAEVTGKAFSDLLAPPDRAAFQSFLTRLSQDPLGEVTVSELTLAGTELRLRCRPIIDNGEIAAFLVTGYS